MTQFKDLLKNFDNMGFHSYRDGDFFTLPHAVWFDELGESDESGVLKANFRVDGRLRQMYTGWDTHSLIVSASGLGKTTQFCVPTIKSYARAKVKRNLVISDPKGELRELCERDLRENGYKVYCLDLRDYKRSECWNPLTHIFRKYKRAIELADSVELVQTPDGCRYVYDGKVYDDQRKLDDAIERDKSMLLDAVGADIDNIAGEVAVPTGAANDKMWEDGARDILKAFLWAMLEDSQEETSITEKLVTEDTYSFATLLSLAKVVTSTLDSYRSLGKDYFESRDESSLARYYATNTVLGIASETASGFVSVFNTQLSVFKMATVRIITSCNSFEFKDLLDGPVAIFINYPDEMRTTYVLISLFVQNLYIYLLDAANKCKGGKLPTPWYFILDEFGNFPKMVDFETVISASRSRNIFFSLVVQSYAQLENVYGKNTAEIIKDNLNVHIFLGSNNSETLEAISRECGKMTRISPLSALNGKTEEIDCYELETIPLVPVSRLTHFEEGECIVTEANSGYVLFSRLERYYKCPEFLRDPNEEPLQYHSATDPYDPKYNYGVLKLKRKEDDDDWGFGSKPSAKKSPQLSVDVEKFIAEADALSVPRLQLELGMSYRKARAAMEASVAMGIAEYCGGFDYAVVKKAEPEPEPESGSEQDAEQDENIARLKAMFQARKNDISEEPEASESMGFKGFGMPGCVSHDFDKTSYENSMKLRLETNAIFNAKDRRLSKKDIARILSCVKGAFYCAHKNKLSLIVCYDDDKSKVLIVDVLGKKNGYLIKFDPTSDKVKKCVRNDVKYCKSCFESRRLLEQDGVLYGFCEDIEDISGVIRNIYEAYVACSRRLETR